MVVPAAVCHREGEKASHCGHSGKEGDGGNHKGSICVWNVLESARARYAESDQLSRNRYTCWVTVRRRRDHQGTQGSTDTARETRRHQRVIRHAQGSQDIRGDRRGVRPNGTDLQAGTPPLRDRLGAEQLQGREEDGSGRGVRAAELLDGDQRVERRIHSSNALEERADGAAQQAKPALDPGSWSAQEH